jgi:NAD(P)-dependent dehydrogenase (short-subunit alcohol dehydrogenase family)
MLCESLRGCTAARYRFLTSDDAAFTTGQTLNVDGGWVQS